MRRVSILILLSVTFLTFFSLSTFPFSKSQTALASCIQGDVNEDSRVNIFDLLKILEIITKKEGITERAKQLADLDKSGAVDIFDLLESLKLLKTSKGTVMGINMVSIPGGTFLMGSDSGAVPEIPVHAVSVSGFQMSATEITNAQYAEFLNEAFASGEIVIDSNIVKGAKGEYTEKEYIDLSGDFDQNNKCWISFDGSGFCAVEAYLNWPVVFVTWYGAKAFALKQGYDLPTEAEWEYAARGGRQFEYSTDDGTISADKANYDRNIGYPTEVGTYPANPFGMLGMSGNVLEWCNDWFGDYSGTSSQTPVENPSGPGTGIFRVVRGGGWSFPVAAITTSVRSTSRPDDEALHVYGYLFGFRVVKR